MKKYIPYDKTEKKKDRTGNFGLFFMFVFGLIMGVLIMVTNYEPKVDSLIKENTRLEEQLAETRGMLDSTIGHIEMEKENKKYDKP